MNPIIFIILTVNLIAFLQMGIDKRLAIKGQWRISEAQLIAPALFAGILGIILGMLAFRHKTAKRSFQIKLAIAIILFAGALYYYTQMP